MAIIGAAGRDQKVKVSSTDTKSDTLIDKLEAGSNITLTKVNAGGDETLRIDASGTGSNVVTTVVNAGATINIDTIDLNDFCAIDYQLCAFSTAQNRYRALKLFCGLETSNTVEHTLTHKIGDNSLNIRLDFKVVATDAVLEVVNNEVFAVTVRYSKTTI